MSVTPIPFFSVGHSSRLLEALVHLLRAAAIRHVADVRRFPSSHRYPWFGRAALREGLHQAGIGYTHFEALGGMREPPADPTPVSGLDPDWQGYAAHLHTPAAEEALEHLLRLAAAHGPVALLCAERDPAHCHRRFLCDVLVARGYSVTHLLDDETRLAHTLHPLAELEDGKLEYRPLQGSLF